MDPVSIIATVRKLWYFLSGLFPVLDQVLTALKTATRKIFEHPLLAAVAKRLSASRPIKALAPVSQRFYWRDYGKDRLNLEQLPQELLPVLRPVFLVSISLCLLIPTTMFNGWRQPIETMSGFQSTVPTWSICLWIIAAALGWGCLLSGTAISNRPAFTSVTLVYLVVFGSCALYLPPSLANLIIPLAAFLALFFSELAIAATDQLARLSSKISATIVGIACGAYAGMLTPLGHWFGKWVWMAAGWSIGLLLMLIARFFGTKIPGLFMSTVKGTTNERLDMNYAGPSVQPLVLIQSLSLLSGIFLISLVMRSDMSRFAGQLVSLLSLWNGYLWPVWYFIGVGIIFKLLKSSAIVSTAIKDLFPPSWLVPSVVLLTVAGTCFLWSEDAISVPATNPLAALTSPLTFVYAASSQWFWHKPLYAISAHVMKWILSADLVIILWMLLRKRLTSSSAASMLYLTVLAGFLIFEYMFQFLAFSRTPVHSMTLMMIFCGWLLWLFHTVGLQMGLRSSPLWPSLGRLSIYGSIVIFCLLEIHARCAIKDLKVMNEIFLVLFRGIIDIGMPYYLYVFATRRFKELPVRLSTIFSAFCLGALLSLPFNVLDKLALSHWSLASLHLLWSEQVKLYGQKGIIALDGSLPDGWILARTGLFIAVIVLAALCIRHKLNDRQRTPSALVFVLLALASGFASFSKTSVLLPLPSAFNVLIAPVHISHFLDTTTVALYLSAWLPVLIISLWIGWQKKVDISHWLLAASCAYMVSVAINLLWPNHEALLRATGLLETLGLGAGASFVMLSAIAVNRIEQTAQDSGQVSSEPVQRQAPVLTMREARIVYGMSIIVLSVIASIQLHNGRLIERELPSLRRSVAIPAQWGEPAKSGPDTPAIFTLRESNGRLMIGKVPSGSNGAAAAMQGLLVQFRKNFKDFSILKVEDWKSTSSGAVAAYYSYYVQLHNVDQPLLGLVVLVPRPDGFTELYKLTASPDAFDQRRWDITRILLANR